MCSPGTEGSPGEAVGSSPICIQCSVAMYNDEYGSSTGGCKGCPLVNLQMKLEEQCVQHVHGDTTKMRLSNHRAKYVQSVNLQM